MIINEWVYIFTICVLASFCFCLAVDVYYLKLETKDKDKRIDALNRVFELDKQYQYERMKSESLSAEHSYKVWVDFFHNTMNELSKDSEVKRAIKNPDPIKAVDLFKFWK